MKFSTARAAKGSPPSTRPKPTFLTLPLEIRIRIYEHFFSQREFVARFRKTQEFWCINCHLHHDLAGHYLVKPRRDRAIFFVCHQILEEACPVAYQTPVSCAIPYIARQDLPPMPPCLCDQIQTVKVTSRGVPSPATFKDLCQPHWYWMTKRDGDISKYSLENVKDVILHTYISLPIKVAKTRDQLLKVCEDRTGLSNLDEYFKSTTEALWPEVNLETVYQELGDRSIRIRCSLYRLAIDEERHSSTSEDKLWVSEVSGLLVLQKGQVSLARLRTHQKVEKLEADFYKNVLVAKDEERPQDFGLWAGKYQVREWHRRLGAWRDKRYE